METFFGRLWSREHSPALCTADGMAVRLPHTAVVRAGRVDGWYFTSSAGAAAVAGGDLDVGGARLGSKAVPQLLRKKRATCEDDAALLRSFGGALWGGVDDLLRETGIVASFSSWSLVRQRHQHVALCVVRIRGQRRRCARDPLPTAPYARHAHPRLRCPTVARRRWVCRPAGP
jgi:hypothetical protein